MKILKINALILLIFFLSACASGSSIVTGTTRAPINKDEVKLYLEPPAKYETIGLVKASSGSGWTEQGSQNYAISKLKTEAAKLGANGVLITSSGEKLSTIVGTNPNGMIYQAASSAQTLTGSAIYVIEEDNPN